MKSGENKRISGIIAISFDRASFSSWFLIVNMICDFCTR